jgi:hypothetical protein
MADFVDVTTSIPVGARRQWEKRAFVRCCCRWLRARAIASSDNRHRQLRALAGPAALRVRPPRIRFPDTVAVGGLEHPHDLFPAEVAFSGVVVEPVVTMQLLVEITRVVKRAMIGRGAWRRFRVRRGGGLSKSGRDRYSAIRLSSIAVECCHECDTSAAWERYQGRTPK